MKIHNFVLFISFLTVLSTVRVYASQQLEAVSPETVLTGGFVATAVVLGKLVEYDCFSGPQAAVAYLVWNGVALAASSGAGSSAQKVLAAYVAPLIPFVGFTAVSHFGADMCPNHQ